MMAQKKWNIQGPILYVSICCHDLVSSAWINKVCFNFLTTYLANFLDELFCYFCYVFHADDHVNQQYKMHVNQVELV